MVDVVVKIKVASPGELSQALERVKKLIAYQKRTGLGGEGFILRPVTGEIYGFSFVSRYASMAEFEEQRNKKHADSGWMEVLLEGIRSDWHLGSTHTSYEVVE